MNDTKPDENGAPQENSIIELITDPETLRGICSFILNQLNDAEARSNSVTHNVLTESSDTKTPKIKNHRLTVGKKIASSDTPHN